MNTNSNTTDINLFAYDKAESRFKAYLALNFGVYDLGYYATSFGNFLFEDYPELFVDSKLGQTTELIRTRAQQAVENGFVDYRGFRFSKFQKIVERIALSFSRDYWEKGTDVLFSRLDLDRIKRQALYLLVKVPVIEQYFQTCGFEYSTDYCYGDEKEKNLDGLLDVFINSNRIQKLKERIAQKFSHVDLSFMSDSKDQNDMITNTALHLWDYTAIIEIFEKYGVHYGVNLKNVDETLLNEELDKKIEDIFKWLAKEK